MQGLDHNRKNALLLVFAVGTLAILLGAGAYYFFYLAPQPPSAQELQAFDAARLQAHANMLRGHANELKNAMGRASDPAIARHTEHVINLLVGNASPDYGDLDHDGIIEDPGDGTGMFAYLAALRAQADAAGETVAVAKIDRVNELLRGILAQAKTINTASDFENIRPQINAIQPVAHQIARGETDSVPEIAQLLHASATQPGVNPELPQAGTTIVDMQQFVFGPQQLKVKPGTTVVFVNKDNAKHTVTEDSRAWNSLDITAGKTFAFTFQEPGIVRYHCEYHGDVDGVDMAGTIIVSDE
jgi:plastocyanin